MEGSVMCRLRAAVCGGVGVTTGRDIQPSLRPQREVHAVSDKHKPEGGNPGIELCCPRCVKKMTPTCVSLSLPVLRMHALGNFLVVVRNFVGIGHREEREGGNVQYRRIEPKQAAYFQNMDTS